MAWQLFLLLPFVSFFFLRRWIQKKKVNVEWPIIGTLPSLLANVHRLHDWLTDILREKGCTDVHNTALLAQPTIITCDPANVTYIARTNFSNFNKGTHFSQTFDALGDGVLTTDSDSWKAHRKMANAIVIHRSFRKFLAKTVQEKARNGLIPVLEHTSQQDMVVDLQDVFHRFTFDNACTLIFGADPGCLSIGFPTVPIAKAIYEGSEAIIFRNVMPNFWWKFQRWLKIGEEKKLANAKEVIDNFIAHYISVKREDLEKLGKAEAEDATDMLTSYMDYQCNDETGQLKSDKFLRDSVMNLLIAGKDTTSSALTWFFWLISNNPSAETKIVEELRSISGDVDSERGKKPRVSDVEELSRLVYLNAALYESLRLYPAVPVVPRVAVQPDVLPSGHRVRPGLMIYCSLYAMGRMEKIWGKDCMEFKPERWIAQDGTLSIEHSNKFLVFFTGPRTCLGKDIALTQMKLVVAALLCNFHVQVVEGQPAAHEISVVLPKKNGLMVRVRKRYG
ncbi:alkane hydroxylase MAH1-like isoform X2 [Magnolia sinica]|uniref:alkane hydroxylase MAH1-like isoform X2 n=1 Tax=Magnolia sinica TaxID=86752 RepID=UPI002657AF82|nr:alkane hydroxylase MAH1-like isoform X2 [Magnolia sinica]